MTPHKQQNHSNNQQDYKNMSTRRGPWSSEEDLRLLSLIDDHGPTNWVRISQILGSRTPKQCRERYHQNLKPSLNHSPISEEEGIYIEQLVAQYGKKWAEIARHLNGRSDNAVKNWWNGGANRRRRATLAAHRRPTWDYGPGGPPPAPGQSLGPPGQSLGPPPAHSGPGATLGPPGSIPAHSGPMPPHGGAIPTHSASISGPPGSIPGPGVHSGAPLELPPMTPYHSQNPAYNRRLSLPNLAPDHVSQPSSYANSHVSSHVGSHAHTPEEGSHPHPAPSGGIVFNSAYTDSAGSAFSGSTSSATAPAAATGTSPVSTRSLHHLPPSRYNRRQSATTVSTGYSSSRQSSIGGLSSVSDTDDPFSFGSSLSKYSLGNSASNSRRNSHVPTATASSSSLDPGAPHPAVLHSRLHQLSNANSVSSSSVNASSPSDSGSSRPPSHRGSLSGPAGPPAVPMNLGHRHSVVGVEREKEEKLKISNLLS